MYSVKEIRIVIKGTDALLSLTIIQNKNVSVDIDKITLRELLSIMQYSKISKQIASIQLVRGEFLNLN
ncbi:MAG: hypothetical protein CMF28_02880 [Kiritimatiellaceae bacterium]|nr:hypothetical protein [Kiritimatiellaceae bacterium]